MNEALLETFKNFASSNMKAMNLDGYVKLNEMASKAFAKATEQSVKIMNEMLNSNVAYLKRFSESNNKFDDLMEIQKHALIENSDRMLRFSKDLLDNAMFTTKEFTDYVSKTTTDFAKQKMKKPGEKD